MATEAALAWKLGLRVDSACLVVVLGVHSGVDVPKMLHEMVLSVAWLDVLGTRTGAQAAYP